MDKIFVIANGKIVEQGTHETLMSSKSDFYQLIKSQETLFDASESQKEEKPKQVEFRPSIECDHNKLSDQSIQLVSKTY